MTSSEFVEWMVYLNEIEPNLFRTEDHYLAQIAMELRRSYVKDPRKVKSMKPFLIKFETKKMESVQGWKDMKSCLLSAFGITPQ